MCPAHVPSIIIWGESDGRDGPVPRGRGGVAMVQDTQGKRWKHTQVSRISTRPARVLWQEALLRDVCPRGVILISVWQTSQKLKPKTEDSNCFKSNCGSTPYYMPAFFFTKAINKQCSTSWG
jgi:hypothetical protein